MNERPQNPPIIEVLIRQRNDALNALAVAQAALIELRAQLAPEEEADDKQTAD
jgi:hypothetical protein